MQTYTQREEPFAGAHYYRELFIALEKGEGLICLYLLDIEECPQNLIVRNFLHLLRDNTDEKHLKILAEGQWEQLVLHYCQVIMNILKITVKYICSTESKINQLHY